MTDSRTLSSPVAAVLGTVLWVAGAFTLVQTALVTGGATVEAQFGADVASPVPYAVAALAGVLLVAGAVVAAALVPPSARRISLVLAGAGALAVGLVVGAMTLQLWSLAGTVADAADVSGVTTAADGILVVVTLALVVGGLAVLATGLAVGRRGRPTAA